MASTNLTQYRPIMFDGKSYQILNVIRLIKASHNNTLRVGLLSKLGACVKEVVDVNVQPSHPELEWHFLQNIIYFPTLISGVPKAEFEAVVLHAEQRYIHVLQKVDDRASICLGPDAVCTVMFFDWLLPALMGRQVLPAYAREVLLQCQRDRLHLGNILHFAELRRHTRLKDPYNSGFAGPYLLSSDLTAGRQSASEVNEGEIVVNPRFNVSQYPRVQAEGLEWCAAIGMLLPRMDINVQLRFIQYFRINANFADVQHARLRHPGTKFVFSGGKPTESLSSSGLLWTVSPSSQVNRPSPPATGVRGSPLTRSVSLAGSDVSMTSPGGSPVVSRRGTLSSVMLSTELDPSPPPPSSVPMTPTTTRQVADLSLVSASKKSDRRPTGTESTPHVPFGRVGISPFTNAPGQEPRPRRPRSDSLEVVAEVKVTKESKDNVIQLPALLTNKISLLQDIIDKRGQGEGKELVIGFETRFNIQRSVSIDPQWLKRFERSGPQHGWLNGDLVNGILQTWQRDQYVWVIDSYMWASAFDRARVTLSASPRGSISSDMHYVKGPPTSEYDIVIPHNDEGNHWLLIFIQRPKTMTRNNRPSVNYTIQVLDSNSKQKNKRVLEVVKRWFKQLPQFSQCDIVEGTLESPQQPNISDCGVHVIENALCLQQRPPNYNFPNTVTHRREYWIKQLTLRALKYKLLLPVPLTGDDKRKFFQMD